MSRTLSSRERPLSFVAAAEEDPERIAVVVDGASVTYGELAVRVRRAMTWLAHSGIDDSPDRRVAVVAHNRIETVVVLGALLEIGVPVVMIHPRWTASERAVVLADARPDLVVEPDGAAEGSDPCDGVPTSPGPARLLAIVYTSGTSGRPKGAMLSRRAFLASAEASSANLGWQDDDRWLLCMPLAHVGGLSIVLRSLIARRTVVLGASATADAISQAIVRDRVTIASLVPTMLRRMLDADWRCPPDLRVILLGGAASPSRLLAEAAARGLPTLTTYGLTEACSQVTTQRYGSRPDPSQGAGHPIAGVELRVVCDQIQLRGPTLIDGYLNIPPETTFLEDGWFPTGDLGHLDEEGRLHVLSRRHDLIVNGGENVYPTEVEAVLERIHGVRSAIVFGIADETWGALVAAALVIDGEPNVILPAVARHAAAELSVHKRPRRIVFLEELPMNATGKVDRAAVASLAAGHLIDVPRA